MVIATAYSYLIQSMKNEIGGSCRRGKTCVERHRGNDGNEKQCYQMIKIDLISRFGSVLCWKFIEPTSRLVITWRRKMRLNGKSCIVTGAAQGIGQAIAERLASEGANVVIVDLNGERAENVAATIREREGKAISFKADVTNREQVQNMIQACVKKFGRLDVIFNNAGFNKPLPFLEITEENWNAIMRVNAFGVLIGTQEAAKQMIAQGGGGKIINTASIASRQGYPDFAPYCASKFAVVALIQAAARAFAAHKITVNGFAPGVVATPLWETLDKDLIAIGTSSKPGEAMESFSQGILIGRPALPADIAGTAAFLASSDADYMTGQVVAIDGGMILV
jgi:meso-butanediol dehydrogenase/(S,S)-butanediol dehydrogenase/diacetyl reductase